MLQKKIGFHFLKVLKEVSKEAGDSFSGLGMLLYEKSNFSKDFYADLRPSFSCPQNVILGQESVVELLLEIADRSNPLHDGFIFFDEGGLMTHVAQYFAPKSVDDIIANESYGNRYRTAQYGSFVDGVLLTGVVNGDKKCFVFKKGRAIGLYSEI